MGLWLEDARSRPKLLKVAQSQAAQAIWPACSGEGEAGKPSHVDFEWFSFVGDLEPGGLEVSGVVSHF